MDMEKLINRIISIMLSVMIVFSGSSAFTLSADAVEETGSDGIAEIQEQSNDQTDAFAPEDGYRLLTSGAKPASYDLRDVDGKSYITPVRQQNPYGTCWGFGAIAAAESSILSEDIASEKGYDSDTLDLSEKQLAWFVAQSINDKDNPQYGEGLQFRGSVSDKAKYNLGGFTIYATSLFASGAGPVAEQTVTNDGEIFRYRGRMGLFFRDGLLGLMRMEMSNPV